MDFKGIEKMLRAIANAQSATKQELMKEIKKLRVDMNKGFKEVKSEIMKNRKRIDVIGKQVAFLEDDAPTREEFETLEKRVGKVEQQVA